SPEIRSTVATARFNLGNLYAEWGKLKEARATLEQSLANFRTIADRRGIASTLDSLAEVDLKQKRLGPALQRVQEAISLAEATQDAELQAACQRNLGDIQRASGHQAEAIAAYEQAIDNLERVRGRVSGGEKGQNTYLNARLAFMAGDDQDPRQDVYHALVGLLVRQNDLKKAHEYLERARSKFLLDAVRIDSLRDPAMQQLLDQAAALEERVAAQEAELRAE